MGGVMWEWPGSNAVTWLLAGIVAFSIAQGLWRGASGSAKRLVYFLSAAIAAILSIVLAAAAATALSPRLQAWLAGRGLERPAPDADFWPQLGYTALSGLRDLTLLRFSLLFLLCYAVVRFAVGFLVSALASAAAAPLSLLPAGGTVSRTAGGAIGAALGAGRALLVIVCLFAYSSLFPQGPFNSAIRDSGLYREVAARVIEPAAGSLLEDRLPVFAEEMSAELDQLWQRRYEAIDANLPADIGAAALSVTAGSKDDEDKARALYDWVGSRIAYDYGKVAAYEERGVWLEQGPAQTFATRKGVCIDYARLYAAMARAVDLDVRVVTGLGYDGRGGFGAHAWNEVRLAEEDRWIKLDATWAKSGNWFDPPGFDETHIKDREGAA